MTKPEIAYTLDIHSGNRTTKNAQRVCNCQRSETMRTESTLGNSMS